MRIGTRTPVWPLAIAGMMLLVGCGRTYIYKHVGTIAYVKVRFDLDLQSGRFTKDTKWRRWRHIPAQHCEGSFTRTGDTLYLTVDKEFGEGCVQGEDTLTISKRPDAEHIVFRRCAPPRNYLVSKRPSVL